MRVLVACEFSGTVRRAFRELGHDAWSCDLLPAEDGSEFHIQGNVIDHDIVKRGWDMLIAFPDCTYLTVSANRWANEPWRMEARHWALAFVRTLWALPIAKKAIENPIGVLPTMWKRPTQIIQPWQFGHGETKATCLWLDNLPLLEPSDIVVPEWAVLADGSIHMSAKGKRDNPTHFLTGRTTRVLKGAQLEQWERIHKEPPGPERWKNRSRTYPGVAAAMAGQWGGPALALAL